MKLSVHVPAAVVRIGPSVTTIRNTLCTDTPSFLNNTINPRHLTHYVVLYPQNDDRIVLSHNRPIIWHVANIGQYFENCAE